MDGVFFRRMSFVDMKSFGQMSSFYRKYRLYSRSIQQRCRTSTPYGTSIEQTPLRKPAGIPPTLLQGTGLRRVHDIQPGPVPSCTLPKTRAGSETPDNPYVAPSRASRLIGIIVLLIDKPSPTHQYCPFTSPLHSTSASPLSCYR